MADLIAIIKIIIVDISGTEMNGATTFIQPKPSLIFHLTAMETSLKFWEKFNEWGGGIYDVFLTKYFLSQMKRLRTILQRLVLNC